MKLKEWLAKVDKIIGSHDLKTIDYQAGRINGKVWYNNITGEQIRKYPLLLECDVIEEKEYDSEYILASFTSMNCGSGKCKQYSCRLDADEVAIAFKNKGLKSLWKSGFTIQRED